MANLYDKDTIFTKLKDKISGKGFVLDPDKGKMAKETRYMVDLLEGIAEAMSDILTGMGDKVAVLNGSEFKIGPSGQQNAAAFKDGQVKSDITTDPDFWAFVEAFYTVLNTPTIPEPGNGSPSMFHTMMKASMMSVKPSKIKSKIVEGSSKIKITT
jgi:hypothetical protein